MLVWPARAWPADATPPDYVRPAPLQQAFSAARARVVVVDARPSAKPTQESESQRDDKDPLSEAALRDILQSRLREALGNGAGELVFRVKLVEAREVSESPPKVRAVIDITAEREGRVLSSTRGVSTLVGGIGGMTPQTAERIQAAIVDAFERSVLRATFIDTVNAALGPAAAGEAPAGTTIEPVTQAWTIRYHEASAQAHVLSAVFDGGKTYAFGARYLHDHISSGGGLIWGGYGAEARVISDDFSRLDAAAGLAVLRGGFGVEQAFSIELGFGAGGRDDVRAIGVGGIYFTFYYVDLGFTYQLFISPTSELEPLSGPHFGLRIYIPVAFHSRHTSCRSPLPCEPTLLPGQRTAPSADDR
jgi:hypothetical protein